MVVEVKGKKQDAVEIYNHITEGIKVTIITVDDEKLSNILEPKGKKRHRHAAGEHGMPML
jgi:hypothetical protein